MSGGELYRKGEEMEIRTFRREDAGDVVNLWNTTLREEKTDSQWYVEESRLSEEKLETIISHPNFETEGVFVACEGRAVVGFGRGVVKRVQSHSDEDLKATPGYLEGLVVNPSCRRQGIGTQIFERIESYVKASGKEELHIVRNRSAIAGISVIPDTPEYTFLVSRGFEPKSREMRLRLPIMRIDTGILLRG